MNSKGYDPAKIENKWYSYWTENKLFAPGNQELKPYTIVIPPPNVTGILHMGHVLNNTLQDILIRFKRMQQHPTLWVPGTDHAGIATQNKVEEKLRKDDKKKEDLGREDFLKLVWQWKEQHGGIIIEQLKRMGCSCDWDRERFTLDTGLSKAVREVFVQLYEKGLIYRGKYIVNWCPRCCTAISDEEVEHKTQNGKLWYIRYPGCDGSEGVIVATTRPETMLGDVAVAVNPADERFSGLIGNSVMLPLQNRPIPVVSDEMVDIQFGTGAVKITPAHDANDFEAAQRHTLPIITVIDEHGMMNSNAGSKYFGMDRYECRKAVLKDLNSQALLVKVEDYVNNIGNCYRCATVVEPYLSQQWFVKMKPLAEPALQAVLDGKIKFYPDRWTKVYINWMEGIRDWCISRQLWWGHRIPVWTCGNCGHSQAFRDDPECCPKCQSGNLTQDPDVLDTWFSSWLWPFSTLGWPDKTSDLKRFYPTQTMITAPEIIFFWVARMIMAGIEFMQEIPFDKVYLHGTVRDGIGRKMSKSLGNSPDPLDIMSNIGADALRFSMVMISPRGSDIFFSEDSLNLGRNFNNKIWNAGKLVIQNCDSRDQDRPFPEELRLFDRWILYRLAMVNKEVTEHLETFKFNEAAVAIHRFIWHEYCDWYLEIAKLDLYAKDSSHRKSRIQTILVKTLGMALQLLHPFAPFITEEMWSRLYPGAGSIMISQWPVIEEFLTFETQANHAEIVQRAITAARTIRSETHVPPSAKIELIFCSQNEKNLEILNSAVQEIEFLTRTASLIITDNPVLPDVRATAVTPDGIDVFLNLEGLVDVPMEIARLEKEIKKTEDELKKVSSKLSNPNFVNKAPEEVVEKNKKIFTELTDKKEKLTAAIQLFSKGS